MKNQPSSSGWISQSQDNSEGQKSFHRFELDVVDLIPSCVDMIHRPAGPACASPAGRRDSGLTPRTSPCAPTWRLGSKQTRTWWRPSPGKGHHLASSVLGDGELCARCRVERFRRLRRASSCAPRQWTGREAAAKGNGGGGRVSAMEFQD